MTSKTYCPLPFVHLNIGPRSTVTPCCHFDDKIDDTQEDIRFTDIKDINRSKKWRTLQKDLVMGKKPAGCHKCYTTEDSGIVSQRQYAINTWGDKIVTPDIKSLELKLGAKCNLACRTCSSDSSNKWLKEESLLWFGHINKEWMKQKQSLSHWASDEDFWNNLHDISHNLESITFTGGEPMLISEHFKYLEWLANNNINPVIDYITNATVPLSTVKSVFDRFEKISMSLSIDAVGRLSNYIRTGSEWEELYTNIKDYAEYFRENGHKIDISTTVSVLNVHKIGQMAKLATSLNIKWYLNFLTYPTWMQIQNLSEANKNIVIDNISKLNGVVREQDMKELYKIIKVLQSEPIIEESAEEIPIWRHILQRDYRHNRANPNRPLSFSRVEPAWWDNLIINENY